MTILTHAGYALAYCKHYWKVVFRRYQQVKPSQKAQRKRLRSEMRAVAKIILFWSLEIRDGK